MKQRGRVLYILNKLFGGKKLFWICVIGLSGWGMTKIFILTLTRFNTDSTSIGVTTTYIHWTNTFPAVSICLGKNRISKDFSEVVIKRAAQNETPPYTYIRTIYDYLFVNPNNFYIKAEYCKGYNSTCGVNILEMRKELLARSCKVFMEQVYFSDVLVEDCESIFKFHDLEMGYCFLANNLMDYEKTENLPLKYWSGDKKPSLKLFLKSGLIYRYELYVHSPEDLPYFNAVSHTVTNDPLIYSFNVEEIHNSEDVIYENIDQRLCKFPSENDNDKSYKYGFSSCISKIRNKMELEYCNCTLYAPNPEDAHKYCGIKGVSCLDESNISGMVTKYVGSNTICLPSCVEQQIAYVGSTENQEIQQIGDNYVEIVIASIPSARYFRTVTQTKLDLIVGIGGVIGLFIGASLLNILELFQWLYKKIKTFC